MRSMRLPALLLALGLIAFFATTSVHIAGQGDAAPAIDNDDIGGVVTGAHGPEAGVWVIAETRSTPTRLIKSVVTDDRGRYVVPDLAAGEYNVWVRGYGLVDSPKVKSAPGKASTSRRWPRRTRRPRRSTTPRSTGSRCCRCRPRATSPAPVTRATASRRTSRARANGSATSSTPTAARAAIRWAARPRATIPPTILGKSETLKAAWDRRIQSGQAGGGMSARFTQVGRERALSMYADWTDRIAKGELPTATPPRPQGVERNVVVTMWDWADPKVYLHDEISSDKRNPTVNANGPIYGALEESGDYFPVVDPKTNTASQIKIAPRDPDTPSSADQPPAAASPYWGDEVIWNSQTTVHSFAMDKQGRIWAAGRVRKPQTPAWCQAGSDHPSAKLFPINQGQRGLIMYDPKTKQITTIDTCFTWGHLNFDDNDVLWSSFGPTGVEGWFDMKIWDKTHDEKAAQGWSAFVLDNNGNGKRDAYTEPNEPVDPTKDRRLAIQYYGDSPASDGSVWGTVQGMPGALVRFVPGAHPPETALTEIYEVPWNNPKASAQGFSPRGMDVDSKNVVWTVLSSGHLASFDRRKCKGTLNGPTATGQHCPEGWSLYPVPGPNYKGAVDNASADSVYYDFVDRFDLLGVGKDVPIATGNLSEGLLALVGGKLVTFRVPYPMGSYAKGLDGRIDNPNGGWKGKAIYTPPRRARRSTSKAARGRPRNW